MSQFSIKEIEQLTGIRAHTLRIWEQRYNLPKPKRSPGNVRFYDDADLRLLLNVSVLNRNGHRISEIIKFSDTEIGEMVGRMTLQAGNHSLHINAMMTAMLDLDESRFNRVLTSCILQSGLENTMMEVIFPFMSMVGLLWQTGTLETAYEHFMSALLRQKLIVAIDGQEVKHAESSKSILLFLPEGEFHELGLLFGNFILRAAGHQTLYLGQNLPMEHLENITRHFTPDFILTSLTSSLPSFEPAEFIKELQSKFPEAELLVTGGRFLNGVNEESKVRFIRTPEDLKKLF